LVRQHVTPLLTYQDREDVVPLTPLPTTAGADAVSEATIQTLVQRYPSCLPIAEIDPLFCGPVPICVELNTPAGSIDNFLVTPSGLPVLVECKLWRNPEGRREVVGQILDYAKELSRWSSSDLQREVSRRLKREGNPLLDLVREAGHDVDEADFNDALTLNLRRGRFLLLIVGDGIREGVEAIAEYLQAHAGLHFTLGLVELPIYSGPDGIRLIVPRVLARTQTITRTVVAAPDGMLVSDEAESETSAPRGGPVDEMTADRLRFWTDFVNGLALDDPEQPAPKVSKQGYIWVSLPVRNGSAWLTVFRSVSDGKVGVFMSYTRNSLGEQAVRRTVADWETIREELGGTVTLYEDKMGRPVILDELSVGSLADPANRERAMVWLRSRLNDFINALRPRIKAAVADLNQENR
jgi:hypothetical protein